MADMTVIFDLDGTLIDTAPDLVRATNFSLKCAGLPPVSADVIKPHVGFGARRMILAGLEAQGKTLDDKSVDELLGHYLEHYAQNICIDSRPYPYVIEEIETLRREGARLAICTNKLEHMSRRLIDSLGVNHYFSAIVGRDTLSVCKPHPDHLLETIKQAGGTAARSVMIGDTETDITTARAAGVPVIGVSFGYSPMPIEELNPDRAIDTYQGLSVVVHKLLTRE